MTCRLLAKALSWRCFTAVRRELQRPPPTQIRPYPPRRLNTPKVQVSPVDIRAFLEYQALESIIGLAEWEISELAFIKYL
jgi:hypothetical protein